MNGSQVGWSVLSSALDLLERHAREGRHAERRALAMQMLELHPDAVELHVHRVLATLELEGWDAARAALRVAAKTWFDRGEMLPDAFLETYRTLAVRGVMHEDDEPDYDSELLEVSPVLPSGLYRVTFASGGATQMSATLLERLYGVRIGAKSKVVH
ncbi:MAG: hypothetical protein HC933_10500 [Pleurocapsa sp. SU_196_0]|nr:hypothetical protein [Pleurocapsa sp. SU_196_0]